MFEIIIKGDMAAAHFLRGYEGKCKNLHGHTWKIEVVLLGKRLDKIGMVADFRVLKKKLRAFLDTIDHVCLNDLTCFKKANPTTENLARYIYRAFAPQIAPLKVKEVRAWESDVSGVVYCE